MNNANHADPYAGERLLTSHFHPRQSAFNLRDSWGAWNGYKFANHYYDAVHEYFCIRNTCGTYDICPMQKYHITGTDAERMLNRLVTRDVTRLKVNRVTYAVWCTDDGRVVDDGTIFRFSDTHFQLTSGSPCKDWLQMSAFGYSDVTITDKTHDIAALSLQGRHRDGQAVRDPPVPLPWPHAYGIANRIHRRPWIRALDRT